MPLTKNAGLYLIIALGAIRSSLALPITLPIDFRTWSGANGLESFTLDGVTATAGAIEGATPVLSQSPVFGLGVDSEVAIPPPSSEDPTEVGPGETLGITFNLNPSNGQGLIGAWITQLMPQTGLPSENGSLTVVHAGGVASFSFTGANADGELFISFGGPLDVQSATFFGGIGPRIFNPDFSVAGFERESATASAPDADCGSFLLLATALSGLGVCFRRASMNDMPACQSRVL